MSAKGDDLERVKALVEFEMFQAPLETAVPRGDHSKGGRHPFEGYGANFWNRRDETSKA
ncbi:hypothetical protein [Methylocapsa acidiphila]|uniref:hypothetical protein n=1 Tax=Methylocapsa acidiphila TaxID=133552 RepID=UPI0018DD1BD5|nr:hypothetical protein [Methylocapsa acidiphila]